MEKIFLVIVFGFILTGCNSTNPPEPPKSNGDWHTIVTDVKDIQAR